MQRDSTEWKCACGVSNWMKKKECRGCSNPRGKATNNESFGKNTNKEPYRKLFDKYTRSKESYNDMNLQDSKKFLKALLDFGNLQDLVFRLTNEDEDGEKCLKRALSYADTAPFVKEFVLPFLARLGDDKLAIGLFKRSRESLLTALAETFLLETLTKVLQTEELSSKEYEPVVWFVLQLVSMEGTGATWRKSKRVRTLVDSLERHSSSHYQRIDAILKGLSSMKVEALQDIQEIPNNRHSNDLEDYRSISILPPPDEVQSNLSPYLPSASSNEKTENGMLDRLFRLLREDFVGPLREEIMQKDPRAKRRTFKVKSLEALDVNLKRRQLVVEVSFELEYKKLKQKEFWERTSLLQPGALVCFLEHANLLWFALVADRDPEELAKGKVGVAFQTRKEWGESVLRLKTSQTNLKMVQMSSAFFSFEPVLLSLQRMTQFPFSSELLFYSSSNSLRGPFFSYQTKKVATRLREQSPGQDISSFIKTNHRSLVLDETQRDALLTALQREIALIQGPPGTGKSFIGALAAKVIFDQTSEVILCVCYTNHALDQFLEDLIKTGIPSDAIVRLGATQKMSQTISKLALQNRSPTGNSFIERRILAKSLSSLNTLEGELKRNLKALSQKMDVLSFLSVLYPEYYEEFLVSKSDQTVVGKKGKKVTPTYLFGEWKSGAPFPKNVQNDSPKSLWKLPKGERLEQLNQWIAKLREETVEDLLDNIQAFNQTAATVKDVHVSKDIASVQGVRVIGCTTTGAAKYYQLVQSVKAGVVLVEEAGEILEPHVLACLSSETKQVIMIGDHQQLRPKVNMYSLMVESGKGHNLNRSLFERLILEGYPHSTLGLQHRMHPSISSLVRELTYPSLRDAESVKSHPSLLGLQDRVTFLDHRQKEENENSISQIGETGSKVNSFEVNMVVKVVHYLHQQGYKTDNLVVLTPYLGQLLLLRKALQKDFNVLLSELDAADLTKAGALATTSTSQKPKSVRVATIDNYQGEEADVVVVSLVRSNDEGNIGFLQEPERVNVMLSRARNGMIILGNSETFLKTKSKKGKELWTNIFNILNRDAHIYSGLPIVCQKHPTEKGLLKEPNDFDLKAKDGGCTLKCGAMLPCNLHTCSRQCHPGDHSKKVCEAVMTEKCPKNHLIQFRCNEQNQPSKKVCKTCEKLKKEEEKENQRRAKEEADALEKKAKDELRFREKEAELLHQRKLLQAETEQRARQQQEKRIEIEKEFTEKKRKLLQENHSVELQQKETALKEEYQRKLAALQSQSSSPPVDKSSSSAPSTVEQKGKPKSQPTRLSEQKSEEPSEGPPTEKGQRNARVSSPMDYDANVLSSLKHGLALVKEEQWFPALEFFSVKESSEAKYLTSLCDVKSGGDDPSLSRPSDSPVSAFVWGLIEVHFGRGNTPLVSEVAENLLQLSGNTKSLLPPSWVSFAEKMAQPTTASHESSPTLSTKEERLSVEDEWEREKNESFGSSPALDKSMEMIGLAEVKKQMLSIYQDSVLSKEKNSDLKSRRFNVRLEGNPGTGKTTVARLYATFLLQLGAISGSAVEETSGSKLAHEGVDGLKKLLEGIEKKGGGLLFVDEAYQLDPKGSLQGKAVLDYFLTELENKVGRLVVAFAGYPKPMEELFAYNEGLPSRFPFIFKFEDYQDSELLAILQHQLKQEQAAQPYEVEGGTDGKFMEITARRIGRGRGRVGFGNARAVKNYLEGILRRQSNRIKNERREGHSPDLFYLSREDLLGTKPTVAFQSDAWKKLQEMIGLEKVKQSLKDLVGLVETNYELEMQLLPPRAVALNRLFLGNPGVGKTTVAKLYGSILNTIGLLSKGEVILKAASDFIGSVVGQSEEKTNAILKSAEGCVLVIDEAYGLFPKGSGDPYKESVINTLVEKVQNVPGEDLCVLLLGYRSQMEEMMRDANPGLARRFSFEEAFVFEDYTDTQLMQILNLKLKQKNLTAPMEAKIKAIKVLEQQKRKPNFGNGGAVENLISAAIRQFESRTSSLPPAERIRQELSSEDFCPTKKTKSLEESFADIIGCSSILEKLKEYQKEIEFQTQRGRDPLANLEFTFLFVGSPGTGKTTVARRMGELFESLGVLGSSEVVEKSATDLQTGFVGQAGQKTRKVFEEALGKVLFIDEAYRLNPAMKSGSFMGEVLDEMVQLLTEPQFKGKLVVILAGYEHDMDRLMEANAGLKRRFSQKFFFEDFTVDECWKLLRLKLKSQDFQLEDSTCSGLSSIMHQLLHTPNWGNGGDIDTLAKRIQTHLAARGGTNSSGETVVSPEELQTVLQKFLEEKKVKSGERMNTPKPSEENSFAFETSHVKSSPSSVSTNTQTKVLKTSKANESDTNEETEESRDDGVDNKTWKALQLAKRKAKKEREEHQRKLEEARKAAEEAERKRLQKEKEEKEARERARREEDERKRKELERIAKEKEEEAKRLAELREKAMQEQQRLENERRKQHEVQQKLRRIGNCPAGFNWYHTGNGWRCGGGSHFVTDGQLNYL